MPPSQLTLSDLERSKSSSLRFRSLVSGKEAEKVPILLVIYYIYWESNNTIDFDIELHWKVKSGLLKFASLLCRKEAELVMLLLNIDRKQYKGSLMTPSYVTLIDLKGKSQDHLHL